MTYMINDLYPNNTKKKKNNLIFLKWANNFKRHFTMQMYG